MLSDRCLSLCPVYNVGVLWPNGWSSVEVYLTTKWHLDPSSCLATIDMGRKLGRWRPSPQEKWGVPPFSWGGGLSLHLTQRRLSRGHIKWHWHLDSSSRLATINIVEKWGLVPIQHNVAWAETYLRTKWYHDASSRLATIDMGQKIEGCFPFFSGELGPHLTKSPGPRPTSIPSGILIYAAI